MVPCLVLTLLFNQFGDKKSMNIRYGLRTTYCPVLSCLSIPTDRELKVRITLALNPQIYKGAFIHCIAHFCGSIEMVDEWPSVLGLMLSAFDTAAATALHSLRPALILLPNCNRDTLKCLSELLLTFNVPSVVVGRRHHRCLPWRTAARRTG